MHLLFYLIVVRYLKESSILKFPGVLINRTSTERPEVLDKGTVIVGGISYDNLVQSVELAKSMQENNEPMLDAIDYKDTNVSTKSRENYPKL